MYYCKGISFHVEAVIQFEKENNVDHATTVPHVKYVGGKLAGRNWTGTLSCS